jgi:hypothetical protein
MASTSVVVEGLPHESGIRENFLGTRTVAPLPRVRDRGRSPGESRGGPGLNAVSELNSPRQRLSHPAAELIAASADRLEAQAARVRPTDKALALQLLKEATKLRQYARTVDVQHKRAARVEMKRGLVARDPRGDEPREMPSGF